MDSVLQVKPSLSECYRNFQSLLLYRWFNSESLIIKVQCQLFCTGLSYCDFILWIEKDVHIEQVYPDNVFWLTNIEKAHLIFQKAILPEVFGRFFSHPAPSAS